MKDYKKRCSDNKLLKIYYSMLSRCNNTNNKDYKNYGGKGIKVCNEWLDYENFRVWSLSNGYKEGLSIDRIDNTKGYNPDNCEWVTVSENVNRMFKFYNGSPCRGRNISEDTKSKISSSLKQKYIDDPSYKDRVKHDRDTNGNTKINTDTLNNILERYHNGESKRDIYKDYTDMSRKYFYTLLK